MYKSKDWAASTMITLGLIQAFLVAMLLGLYMPFTTEDIKIGSNPFILVRDVFDIPLFANADYLTLIEGRGLNPLLQNYWMTIHPPVLFLGFASLSIPFCMAIGGLSENRVNASNIKMGTLGLSDIWIGYFNGSRLGI